MFALYAYLNFDNLTMKRSTHRLRTMAEERCSTCSNGETGQEEIMTDLENHKIVPENEWIHSRKELLKKEEFTILRGQLSQQRRDMPWVAVNKE
jgi:Bacterial protein of unknown function (DUF899)